MKKNIYLIFAEENLFHPYYFSRVVDNLNKEKYRIVGVTIAKDKKVKGIVYSLKQQLYLWGLLGFLQIGIHSLARKIVDCLGLIDTLSIYRKAKKSKIPYKESNDVNDKEHLEYLKRKQIDIIISSNGHIFKKELLNIPKVASINRHTAILPQYGGVLPVFWAMKNLEKNFGVSIHHMVEQIDQGDIIAQIKIPLKKEASLFKNYVLGFDQSVDLTLKALENLEEKRFIKKFKPNDKKYFSFPSFEQLNMFRKKFKTYIFSDIIFYYRTFEPKILMNTKYRSLLILLLIIIVAIFYIRILSGFFQHDEWQTFAVTYLQSYRGVADVLKDAFVPRASHYAPLFALTFNFLFSIFGLNYTGYAAASFLLHLIVVLLVFIFAQRLTGKMILAVMSALFFGLNASSYQATTWIIANINTHGATIFGLLSLMMLFYFLQKKLKQKFMFLASIIFLVISLLFKEITIAFFAFLPLVIWLYAKVTVRSRAIYCSIILVLGILYLGFRLFMFSLPVPDSNYIVTKDQQLSEVAYNTLTFPAKIFAQSVVPTWQLLSFSKVVSSSLPNSIAGQPGTTKFDQFVENRILQLIDFSVFAFAVTLVVLIWKSRTKKALKRIVVLSFIFVILSSFIYAISPGRSGSIPVIDSRNVYFPSLGTAVFMATVIFIIARGKTVRAIFIFAPLIFLHMYWLNIQLELRTNVGVVRKDILEQIKREHTDLPDKVVFYVASDTAYYGMAEKIPPFETGLGQALLIWYYSTEKFPADFFKSRFLRFITDQGYREINGRGFGYFRDMNLLKETIKQNKLPLDSVISYKFYGGSNILQDNTAQIREELENFKQNNAQ